MYTEGCPECGADWIEIAPDGYTCPTHGLLTREQMAELAASASISVGFRNGNHPEMLSAGTRERVLAERNQSPSLFRTAKEIAASTTAEVDWLVRPWVARGSFTELDGKAKTSGKTTFITHAVRCVLDGLPFMGQPTKKTSVVYLSEQGDQSLREALRRADLLEREDLHFLSWRDVVGRVWQDVAQIAVARCLETDSSLLVVDTLPQFVGIGGEGENSSGPALEATRPLQQAAASYDLGVIAARHERKSGGAVGDSGRGSSAFTGAADIVLSLRRPEGNPGPNLRVIHAVGRFDETPETLVVELTDSGYKSLGSEQALGAFRARQVLSETLPRGEEDAVTIEELIPSTGLGRTSLQEALKAMQEDGEVLRLGTGRRGDAYRFCLR